MLDLATLQLALQLTLSNHEDLCAPQTQVEITYFQEMRDVYGRHLLVAEGSNVSVSSSYHLVFVLDGDTENLVGFSKMARFPFGYVPMPNERAQLQAILNAQSGSKICNQEGCTPMTPYQRVIPEVCDLPIYNPNAYSF